MPSSAQLDGNAVADTPSENVRMSWSVVTQEVDNNRSLVAWSFGWHFGTYSCRGLRQGQIIINGNTYYYNFAGGDGIHTYNGGHDHRPYFEVASGSVWLGHNGDGTGIINSYIAMTGFSGQFSEGWGEWALPTIPRLSSPPSTPVVSNVRQTTADISFTDGGGGAPIDSRQIGYGTNPSSPTTTISSDGSDTLTGLTPATTYYVWARTHNAVGYSDWSPRTSFHTIGGARVKVSGVWKEAIPYVRVSGVWKLARPWVKVMGTWKEGI